MPFGPRLILSLMHFVIILLGFAIMLLVMSFNIWVFIVAIAGFTLAKLALNGMKVPKLPLAEGCSVYQAKAD
jgi:hypothetical protein